MRIERKSETILGKDYQNLPYGITYVSISFYNTEIPTLNKEEMKIFFSRFLKLIKEKI
jgi:hypothetical protein